MVGRAVMIRRAVSTDAQRLAELGARTFSDTFAADNRESDMEAYLAQSFSAEIQSREIADPATTFFLALVGGQPVGYARVRTGPGPACISGDAPIEIVRFYADKAWIRRGVGSSLMGACLEHAVASGCDVVWLDVWEHNLRAIAFYERWRFVVVGEQDFVLGEDVQRDLLMARSVSTEEGW